MRLRGKPILWTPQRFDRRITSGRLARRIALPKLDTPDYKALAKWSRTNFSYSQAELRTCGVPAVDTSSVSSGGAGPGEDASGSSPLIYFLLRSNRGVLGQRNAVNEGLDGRWVASL
jgi:hypothetical protein